jgi:hypothetical protein
MICFVECDGARLMVTISASQEDPSVQDPNCPLQVGLTEYTGKCVEMTMSNGDVKKVCT